MNENQIIDSNFKLSENVKSSNSITYENIFLDKNNSENYANNQSAPRVYEEDLILKGNEMIDEEDKIIEDEGEEIFDEDELLKDDGDEISSIDDSDEDELLSDTIKTVNSRDEIIHTKDIEELLNDTIKMIDSGGKITHTEDIDEDELLNDTIKAINSEDEITYTEDVDEDELLSDTTEIINFGDEIENSKDVDEDELLSDSIKTIDCGDEITHTEGIDEDKLLSNTIKPIDFEEEITKEKEISLITDTFPLNQIKLHEIHSTPNDNNLNIYNIHSTEVIEEDIPNTINQRIFCSSECTSESSKDLYSYPSSFGNNSNTNCTKQLETQGEIALDTVSGEASITKIINSNTERKIYLERLKNKAKCLSDFYNNFVSKFYYCSFENVDKLLLSESLRHNKNIPIESIKSLEKYNSRMRNKKNDDVASFRGRKRKFCHLEKGSEDNNKQL